MTIETWNLEFAGLLEREILVQLHGDDPRTVGGLYGGLHSSQTWEDVCRTKGEINAYKKVLDLMREVARKMNEHDETQTTMRRAYR